MLQLLNKHRHYILFINIMYTAAKTYRNTSESSIRSAVNEIKQQEYLEGQQWDDLQHRNSFTGESLRHCFLLIFSVCFHQFDIRLRSVSLLVAWGDTGPSGGCTGSPASPAVAHWKRATAGSFAVSQGVFEFSLCRFIIFISIQRCGILPLLTHPLVHIRYAVIVWRVFKVFL